MALDPSDLQPRRGPLPFVEEFRGQLAILQAVLEHNVGRLPPVEVLAPSVDRPLESRDLWRRAGNTIHRRDQSPYSHLETAREHLALYLHLTEVVPGEQFDDMLETARFALATSAPSHDPDDDERPDGCKCDPLYYTTAGGHLRGCPLRGRVGNGTPE